MEDEWAKDTADGISDAACLAAGGEDPYATQVLDAARLDGLTGWEEDRASQDGREGGEYDDYSGMIAEGLPPLSRLGGTGAAKRLRMEARRKFLEARTVTSKEAASKVSRRLLSRRGVPRVNPGVAPKQYEAPPRLKSSVPGTRIVWFAFIEMLLF